MPGHDQLGEHIDDEGHVDEPGPAAHVGEVGAPHLVRGDGMEVAVEQIQCPTATGVGDHGAYLLGPANTLQPHLRVGDGAGRHDPAWLFPGPVGARGDLAALLIRNSADRLDRVPGGALIVDERGDQRLRESSSPAKKVVAAFKIATSSRSLRFQPSRVLSRRSPR